MHQFCRFMSSRFAALPEREKKIEREKEKVLYRTGKLSWGSKRDSDPEIEDSRRRLFDLSVKRDLSTALTSRLTSPESIFMSPQSTFTLSRSFSLLCDPSYADENEKNAE